MIATAPGFIAPALPTVARNVPQGPHWIHEIKHDGYRVIVQREGRRVRLPCRPGSLHKGGR